MEIISIHVPREGDDAAVPKHLRRDTAFLSTSPARGTTHIVNIFCGKVVFLSTSPARGTTLLA